MKNPYSPPAAALAADHPDVIARMRLIAIESNVKSIGILFLLQGLFALFDVLILGRNPGNPLYSTPGELNFDDEASLQRLLWSLTLIPGTLSGYLLYQLNGSKPGLTVLCCLPVSLFCGLIGPVLVGHTTWALYSKKGKHIFSTDYKELIERTPNIRPRTTWLTWMFVLGFAALLIFLGLAWYKGGVIYQPHSGF